MKYFFALLLLCLPLMSAMALEVPSLTGPVVDQGNLYSENEKRALSKLLIQLHEKNGPQFQVLTIPSLEGENIEEYSIKVAEKWKIGEKKAGNGLILLIAVQDRKMRIEVGQGIEGEITDYDSHSYIEKILKPAFKQGQFYDGTAVLILTVAEKFQIELKAEQAARAPRSHGSSKYNLILMILIIFFIIISRFLSPRRFYGSTHYGGFYGGGGSSRSSGSSWGGGGGGFSGGGSSGDW